RRRAQGNRGRKLQRLRSERLERSFAHVCETGGARRTWLIGIENVRKRYLISAAAHNLGLLMRSLFKMGTPRGLQQFKTDLEEVVSSVLSTCIALANRCSSHWRSWCSTLLNDTPLTNPPPLIIAD